MFWPDFARTEIHKIDANWHIGSDNERQATSINMFLILMFPPKKANINEVEHVTAKKKTTDYRYHQFWKFDVSSLRVILQFLQLLEINPAWSCYMLQRGSAVIALSQLWRCFRMHSTWKWISNANISGASGPLSMVGKNTKRSRIDQSQNDKGCPEKRGMGWKTGFQVSFFKTVYWWVLSGFHVAWVKAVEPDGSLILIPFDTLFVGG